MCCQGVITMHALSLMVVTIYWAQKLTPTPVNPAQVAKPDKDICGASLVLTLVGIQGIFAISSKADSSRALQKGAMKLNFFCVSITTEKSCTHQISAP